MHDTLTIATTFSDLWNASGLWIVLTACATNCACALVGCYLVLRRMSLMGDALSHAVLPGLAVAFILVLAGACAGDTNERPATWAYLHSAIIAPSCVRTFAVIAASPLIGEG